jgi:cyclic-di-GMP-binding protein
MAADNKIRLTIPRQDLEEFSLFEPNASAAMSWAHSLPVTNTPRVADLLERTISELNRYPLAADVRFAITEALRPNIEIALESLGKKYLNQPLVMPDEPANMANHARQLYSSVATSYTIVAVETIKRPESIGHSNPAKLTCEALYRALLFTGQKILQAFQLYKPVDMHNWQVFHQLYALAEGQQLSNLSLERASTGPSNIKAAYLQCLILSCCKPNKLRQGDLALIYQALAKWSELVSLEETERKNSLFTVDLGSDQPPLYSSLAGDKYNRNRRYIKANKLVAYIQSLHSSEEETRHDSASRDLASHLLKHMIDSLGKMSLRNYNRTPTQATLRVCLGLSSVHYHVAGRKPFEHVLQGNSLVPAKAPTEGGKPFSGSAQQEDDWQRANPEQDYLGNEWLPGQPNSSDVDRKIDLDEATRSALLEEVDVQLPLDQRFPIYKVDLTDASPGGYCLDWSEDLPAEIKTGDIVSLKEEQSEYWVIAVVRWISSMESAKNLIGLELLSPRAKAFGALIHQKDGVKSAPMRVLVLPEIKLVGQPETLIAPRASFHERQRLTIVNRKFAKTIELLRRVNSAAGYSQFEFQYIEELGDVLNRNHRDPLESPYDSVWSHI